MAGKIFINYRRGDDPSAAQALLGRLEQAFLPEQLFMDVDSIKPGLDFVRVLNDQVAQCDVLISIIGKNWLDARDAHGVRRLDNPDDFVRIEIETALQQDKRVIPILVGQAQMPRPEELPDALRPLARRNAVRLTHERFRSDVHGLIKALQEALREIEAQREADAEVKRRAQAEADRQQRQAEAARRAAEEKRRRVAEEEAAERASVEWKLRRAEASQRAQAKRDFNRAKRVGTIVALDGFLATHATSALADEAGTLRTALFNREGAYRHAAASDDPGVLRSFIATYSKGPDVDHTRRQLRRLEPRRGWRSSAGIMIPVTFALLMISGAAAYWFTAARRLPSAEPNVQMSANVPLRSSGKTVTSGLSDQAAWNLLKETTDPAALKEFVSQYPDSPLRKNAEARIAALQALRAVKSPPPPGDAPAPAPAAVVANILPEAPQTKSPAVTAPPQTPAPTVAANVPPEAPQTKSPAVTAPPQTPAPTVVANILPEAPQTKSPAVPLLHRTPAPTVAANVPPEAPQTKSPAVTAPTQTPAPTVVANVPPEAPQTKSPAVTAPLQTPAPTVAANVPPQSPQTKSPAETAPTQTPAPTVIANVPPEAPPTKSPALTAPAPGELERQLQTELKRLGCFAGTDNGYWNSDSQRALEKFNKQAGTKFDVKVAATEAIDAMRSRTSRVCPLVCAEGFRAEGDRCVRSPQSPAHKRARTRPAVASPKRAIAHETSAPRPSLAAGSMHCSPKNPNCYYGSNGERRGGRVANGNR